MGGMATTTEPTRRLTWTLADAIERMRVNASLDQAELADEVGISRSSISNYERGKSTPHNFKTVQRIAEACGYDPADPTLRAAWDTLIARYLLYA
jgi:transcriptional regulator with XRE-family HTH domain